MQISADQLNGRTKAIEGVMASQDLHAISATGLFLTNYHLAFETRARHEKRRAKLAKKNKKLVGVPATALNTPYNFSAAGSVEATGGVTVGGTTIANSSGQVPGGVVNGAVASATNATNATNSTNATNASNVPASGITGGISGSQIVSNPSFSGTVGCGAVHASGTGEFDGGISGCITINSSGAITNCASIHVSGNAVVDGTFKLGGVQWPQNPGGLPLSGSPTVGDVAGAVNNVYNKLVTLGVFS